jgi:hypothetical protein
LLFMDCGTSPTAACAPVATTATGVAGVPGCDYFFANMLPRRPSHPRADGRVPERGARIALAELTLGWRSRGGSRKPPRPF